MIRVPAEPIGRLSEAWRHCVGTGRIELALRRDYQDSLKLLEDDIGFRYIRGHGLLSDGMAVHRPYEWEGTRRVHHSFTYLDQIVDAYLDLGIRPFVELGFMPEELASGKQTVFWWRGHVTPPRSYQEWADLVRATVAHLVDRYGLDEVRTWPIEVWNEPNLADFWENADEQEYHKLYEVTASAVKEVDASSRSAARRSRPARTNGWAGSPSSSHAVTCPSTSCRSTPTPRARPSTCPSAPTRRWNRPSTSSTSSPPLGTS